MKAWLVLILMPAWAGAAELCRAGQMEATAEAGLAAGSVYVDVKLTNRSKTTCTLAGAPRVTALDAQGKALAPVKARWPASVGNVPNGVESMEMPPGARALFVIHTIDSTGLEKGAVCSRALRIFLSGESKASATVGAESCREIEISGYQRVP